MPRMLRRMPRGALEQLVHRRRAVECLDLLTAGFVVELCPPVLDALDNTIAVSRDFHAGHAASFRRRHVGIVRPVFHVIQRGLEESLSDTKDVMAEKPDRAVAIVDRALRESWVRNLPDVALRSAQHGDPLLEQHFGRQRAMPAALQADKFGNVFHVLAKDELAAFCQHRHALRAETEQLLSTRGIVQNIEGGKVNAFFRKKLFRSKTTASTGLGEQDEFVVCDFHRYVLAMTG